MTLILPNEIHNDTPADGSLVEQNYTVIEQYINNDVVNADGSVAMTGQLLLNAGDPIEDNQAARKGYVDALLPIGVIVPYCGQVAPDGNWFLCDGSSKSTSTYAELFGVLGYRYNAAGTGGGSTFALPNMKAKFPIGADGVVDGAFETTGKTGGTFTVPVPQHSHTMAHTHTMTHSHEHVHTHNIAHNHAAFASGGASDRHTHPVSTRQNSTPGTTASYMTASATGITQAADTGSDDPDHTHNIDIPALPTTPSGGASDPTTGPPSVGSTAGSSAASTANTGTAAVTMTQPFVAFNFIIRYA